MAVCWTRLMMWSVAFHLENTPLGPITGEDFLTGAQAACLPTFFFFFALSLTQDATVVGQTLGETFSTNYLFPAFSTMPPYTEPSGIPWPTSCSSLRKMSYSDQIGEWVKSLQKMAPCKELGCVLRSGPEARDEGFAAGRSLAEPSLISGLQMGQFIMMEQKLSGLVPKVWGLLCLPQKQAALDGSAELFESMPARQTAHSATTSQLLLKSGDDSTSLIPDKSASVPLCEFKLFDQWKSSVCLTDACVLTLQSACGKLDCSECTCVSVCQ